ncbi:hypothetical protein C8Z91_08805 [Paenibacillus elgii]|uniref:Uncharacterized protein n=1 Tax=Paenibacillus elgii TaxID=189691 RepID=A0A2T6G5T9_9BACL|nr:hypothetical protein C8Z91_08805 [Paenibacillus elgii]
MVDFILFMVFSIMETMAMYYLMFRLFKFDMYPISIVFASAVASFISYTNRNVYEIQSIDVLVQIFLMFMFVWLLFRVHPFYAGIMTCSTYLGYVIIQATCYFILEVIGIFEIKALTNNIVGTNLLQTLTAFSAWLLGWWIKKGRKGFDFVPHSQFVMVKMSKINIMFIGMNALSVFVLSFVYNLFAHDNMKLVYIFFVLILIMYCILYFSYKKDRSDD